MDLVSTVGEIAALGASGVVMWGSSSDYSSKVESDRSAGSSTRSVSGDQPATGARAAGGGWDPPPTLALALALITHFYCGWSDTGAGLTSPFC